MAYGKGKGMKGGKGKGGKKRRERSFGKYCGG